MNSKYTGASGDDANKRPFETTVSPKSLQLAVNKLATHARQDVHAALKAMLGGHADAVATFVHTDHFDFARAELKGIAAKMSARVIAIAEKHIFEGQVKTAGDGTRRATGFHLEGSTKNARVVEATRSAPDRNGIYSGRVEILDPRSGRWLQKNAQSTFFPASYSKNDVRRAIREAFANAIEVDNGVFEGVTKRGIRVRLVVDDANGVAAAYPLEEM